MKFIQRLKGDKKLRNWVIIFVVIVLIVGNTGEPKKEAAVSQDTCNEANTGGPIFGREWLPGYGWSQSIIDILGKDIGMDTGFNFKPTDTALELCAQNLCKVGMKSVTGPNLYGCFNCISVGLRTSSRNNCCSKEANSISGDYKYLCKSSGQVDPITGEPDPNKPDPKALCDSDFQESIASIADSIPGLDGQTCKTQFYIVTFGGGFLALMTFMVVL